MKDKILKDIKDNLKMFDELQSKYKLNSPDAFYLLAGTVAQESNFIHVKQLNNGPARSYFQIEPATALSVINNYIAYRQELMSLLLETTNRNFKFKNSLTIYTVSDELLKNFKFATFIARMCYYSKSFNFVDHNKEEYARIWKKYYNTAKGKGTEQEFIKNYKLYGIDNIDYKML